MNPVQFTFAFLFLTGVVTPGISQDKNEYKMERAHRVVMQVTEGDSLTQLSVIGQIRNIRKELPGAQIEVVCHANSLDMLLTDGSKVAGHIEELSRAGVVFSACENTMARKKKTRDDLVPGASTVPSGLVEIILKQEEGWSYIKGGH